MGVLGGGGGDLAVSAGNDRGGSLGGVRSSKSDRSRGQSSRAEHCCFGWFDVGLSE